MMTDTLTTAQVLRHVADNLDAGRPEGHGLQSYGVDGWWDELVPLSAITKNFKFRLKPHTRMLNGFEVPAPMDVMPEKGGEYWTIDLTIEDAVDCYKWFCDEVDRRLLERGLAFATKEDAIANFKAICGIDPNGGE